MVENYDQAAQTLRVAGFFFYETCHCGGSLQHKWRKQGTDFEIGVFPNKKMFTVRYASTERNIYTGKYEHFETTVNQYV